MDKLIEGLLQQKIDNVSKVSRKMSRLEFSKNREKLRALENDYNEPTPLMH